MEVREKVSKSRNTVFLAVILGAGGPRSRLSKAADAEPSGKMRDEKLHDIVARSRFQSQKCKKRTVLTHLWKWT